MEQFKYLITDELGIHARPAGQLVQLAGSFACNLRIINAQGEQCDLRFVFKLLSLGIRHGDRVTVVADGEDEIKAIAALQVFFQENL